MIKIEATGTNCNARAAGAHLCTPAVARAVPVERVADADRIAEQITAAGSVFLGYHTPESAGDYASGTNHTLPTNGHARAYSGVSLDSFVKKVTFQRITKEGLTNIGETVIRMAEAEGLRAHAEAVRVRMKKP